MLNRPCQSDGVTTPRVSSFADFWLDSVEEFWVPSVLHAPGRLQCPTLAFQTLREDRVIFTASLLIGDYLQSMWPVFWVWLCDVRFVIQQDDLIVFE